MVGVAYGPDQLRSEQQAIEERLTTDVEIAVTQPQSLVHRRIRLVDVERRRLGLVENLHAACLDFDLAGRQLGVLSAR